MPDQSSAATEHAILQEITAPLATLPDDPVSIVQADFPAALRGYDRMAVDAYVKQIGQLVAELQATRSPEAAVRRALERVGERGHRLGEDDGNLRDLLLVAGLIDAAARKFLRVIVIVLADTDDILRQRADRGREFYALEGKRRAMLERARALSNEGYDLPQIVNDRAADQQRAEVVVLDGSENLAVLGVDCRDTHGFEDAFQMGRPPSAGSAGGFSA